MIYECVKGLSIFTLTGFDVLLSTKDPSVFFSFFLFESTDGFQFAQDNREGNKRRAGPQNDLAAVLDPMSENSSNCAM